MTKLLCILLVAASASAQCNRVSQAGCDAMYLGATPSPLLSTFVHQTFLSFDYTNAAIAGLPQPAMIPTAQIMPCSVGWIPSGPASYGPYITNFMRLLHLYAGVAVQDCNLWVGALSSASGYTGGITSDCAGAVLLTNTATEIGRASCRERV